MPELAFEDFTPGRVFDLGTQVADREEMVDFARRYDPQPFHLDEEAAKASVLGGLCASGWFTASLWMRAFVDGVLSKSTSQGSPGGTSFAWPAPMFPGDEVVARVEILAARESRSRPGIGLVEMRATLMRGETTLFRSDFTGMFATRS
jgi:acyl dehydratase